MSSLSQLAQQYWQITRMFMPVLLVMLLFQAGVIRQWPPGLAGIGLGIAALILGITLVMRALDTAIFPTGRLISSELAERGSIGWLLALGFALGFGAVIAEPSLMAVAAKAQRISEGHLHDVILRLVIAASVGLAVVLSILRMLWGHGIHWYILGGYLLLLVITWLTPAEITGIAMDSGAVSVNIITVPMLLALGLGLTGLLRQRSALREGFGMLALAVLAPRIAVQLYGLVAYGLGGGIAELPDLAQTTPPLPPPVAEAGLGDRLWGHLLNVLRSVAPILLVILTFQLLVLRKPFPHPRKLALGLAYLFAGLFFFIEGLGSGLFPLGTRMAEGLGALDNLWFLCLFVFLLGMTATLVEPALVTITRKAEEQDRRRLKAGRLRWLAAASLGMGLVLGIFRLESGIPMELILTPLILLLGLLALIAPRPLVALAFDLGGVATSDVTVPLITAMGISLAMVMSSGDVMLEAFGLIALASLFPILGVLLHAIGADLLERLRPKPTQSGG